jgi:putative nucleotidyltransferase with HDIG domain
VAGYAVCLAAQYGLSLEMIEAIRLGALLHDVGKLVVPIRILTKPGRLNAREWQELRNHPEIGLELVERQGFSKAVCEIVLYHHERYDGTGYPDRLSRDAISWSVRIVSVMDALDALTSPRSYRNALTIDAARALIAREAGTRFCPWVVSGLLSLPRFPLAPTSATDVPTYLPDGCPDSASLRASETWHSRLHGVEGIRRSASGPAHR